VPDQFLPDDANDDESRTSGRDANQSGERSAKSHDGVQRLDMPTEMLCPRCNTALAGGKLDQFPVAFCPTCFGVLIDNEGIGNVIRIRRLEYSGHDVPPKPSDHSALEKEGRCPNCGEPMEVYFYGGPGNVVMDNCPTCRMVWMDNGEITAIVRAPGSRNF